MKRLKFYNRLRFQLVVIVIFFIIIPIVWLFMLLSNTIKDTFNEKYSTVAQQSIAETGDKINFLLSDIVDYTTSILSNRTFLEMVSNTKTPDSDINELLRGFLASRNDIDGISLINAKSTYANPKVGAKYQRSRRKDLCFRRRIVGVASCRLSTGGGDV